MSALKAFSGETYTTALRREAATRSRQDQLVDRCQKRSERLAGSGRRGDECVTARTNRVPSAALRGRGLTDRFKEPA
jgi:hypothetical protein